MTHTRGREKWKLEKLEWGSTPEERNRTQSVIVGRKRSKVSIFPRITTEGVLLLLHELYGGALLYGWWYNYGIISIVWRSFICLFAQRYRAQSMWDEGKACARISVPRFKSRK